MSSEKPRRRDKCHAQATNQPGWLSITTYVVCAERTCLVNRSGDTQRVDVVNYSPLPYGITIAGRCLNGGIGYLHGPTTAGPEWTPHEIQIDGSKTGRAALRRHFEKRLVALNDSTDESIEVVVSWRCLGNAGAGTLAAPLRIQVDARTPQHV